LNRDQPETSQDVIEGFITDQEFALFQRLIKTLAGIHLSDAKKQLVFGRLRNRVRQVGLNNFESYYAYAVSKKHPEERQIIVDLLTTNETYFFREPRHFAVLRDEILPARSMARPFRVWSAASSSGEEAYSLAMVIADRLGMNPYPSWSVMGSDVSQKVLDQAQRGHYPMQRIDGIPERYLKTFCLKGVGAQEGTLLIDPSLRNRVEFSRINLNDPLPDIGKFDVIFLRNMLIYFQNETKIEIVKRLLDVLQPGGWLIVGHSESVKDFDDRLIAHSPSISRFQPRS
jgi:chemotaxis protein methyltransferase CheR